MMARANRNLSDGKSGAALAIRVTPRAARNEIVEILPDQTIKVRLTAPPVEGKANEALIEFLAEVLGVAKSRIEIVAGVTGRDKLVTIMDMRSEDAQARILKQIKP
jgi:uncharacterized protein (TIGR00251 family)